MNLTSKRMLQFMTVCAGACALSATATTYVSDSFEATDGSLDKPINQYKMVVSGGNNEFTNRVWTSIADDASVLIASDAANIGFATTTRPMNTNAQFVLKLDTNGQPLSRAITNTIDTECSFLTTPVYVDTLIQFTPSEDTPTIETGTKVAIYVNVNSNLVVYHKWDDGNSVVATNSVFSSLGLINPTNWYRLTIQMGQADVGSACQIWLDHQPLSDATTYPLSGYTAGTGPWFMTASLGSTLGTVAFQGTGAVDELVVSTDVPSYGGAPAGIMLTLSYDTNVQNILTNSAAVANGGSVTNGSTVTIQCKDWYQVASITGATYPEYNGDLSASNQLNSATVTLSAAQNTNVVVTSKQYTGAIPAGFGITADLGKLDAWAVLNKKTQSEVIGAGSTWFDDYLLNTPPETNAKLKINTMVKNGATVTITVGATVTSPAVDFTNLNGTLVVSTADTLEGGFAVIGSFSITGTTAETVTITVPSVDGNFIKAVVQ